MANLNSKLKFGNFFTYINNFDIFFLYETHVLADKRIHFSSFLRNYVLYWVDATKIHAKGRAIGGCLFGFKKSIQSKYTLKFCEFQNGVTLSAKLNDVCFHFIPSYINCTNWVHDFNRFTKLIENLNGEPFCIIGDLNARVSTAQTIDDNMLVNSPLISISRKSKDNTIDGEGRKLLAFLDDYGGIIVNGRMAGDSEGEFTFCGVMGSSVIDYCICSPDVLKLLSDFQIPSKPFSDHMPIVVSLCTKNNFFSRELELPQKLPWLPKNIVRYVNTLEGLSDLYYLHSNLPIQEKVNICTGKIRTAAGANIVKKRFDPKNKWYDSQCEHFRKNMLEKLNSYRTSNTDCDRKSYVESRSMYSRLCYEKKLKLKIVNIEKLNNVRNGSEWWKLANSMKSCCPRVGNNLGIVDFYDYFKSLLFASDFENEVLWTSPNIIDPFLDSPFEVRELVLFLKTAKPNKAPGQDRISYEFYKNAPDSFLNEILSLLNFIFLHEEIPDSFRSSVIVPLFKKGDINIVSNYRGLSLLDTMYKMFTGLLLARINSWLDFNGTINEYQAGFRREYSTIDNLFNLTSIVNLGFNQKRKTFAFFVDFSSAFDIIPRNSLFYKLCRLGLSSKIVRILRKLYENTHSRVWDGSSLSDSFKVSQGVRQGCLLSPVLFSLYLNDLPDCLPGGITVAGTVVKVLLYADDIVLLSDSPTDLQNMIDALYIYCVNWGLRINLDKSKIMIFRTGARYSSRLSWKYGNNQIDVVNEYKYLGVIITYNLSFKKHLEAKLASSKIAINATWLGYIHHPKITFSNKLKIFNTAAKSILFYGAQLWGFLRFEEVEKLLRYFLKKMLYLPMNTPNYMLHIETGLPPLYLETLGLHFNYIRKVLNLSMNRLPRLLAEETIRKNTFWFPHWRSLYTDCGISLDIETWRINILHQHDLIMNNLRSLEYNNFVTCARNPRFGLHDMYPTLNYDIPPYFRDGNSAYFVSLIMKARGGLLNLGSRASYGGEASLCTLCNCNEQENTDHLIGKCPIFSGYRYTFFGKRFLSSNEVSNLLNGENYMLLYRFLSSCLKYRELIISEFR